MSRIILHRSNGRLSLSISSTAVAKTRDLHHRPYFGPSAVIVVVAVAVANLLSLSYAQALLLRAFDYKSLNLIFI